MKQSAAYDVVIIGAGAAGMMCAIEAGKRGRKVLLVEHADKPGKKIRISGGGRCNFTNLHTTAKNYISQNPHFCKSALSQYTQQDFISLVEKHGIAYHEKTLGQLFCDGSSQQIIDMLLAECDAAGVTLKLSTSVKNITHDGRFTLHTNGEKVVCESLVVASGGLSIPKMGATDFGYRLAKQFGLNIVKPYPALVPFTFEGALQELVQGMAGVSLNVIASCGKTQFEEGMVFTHRGLSGPAILQISSYWKKGEAVTINLAPHKEVAALLRAAKQKNPKQKPANLLAEFLPKRLAVQLCENYGCDLKLAELPDNKLFALANAINGWVIKPDGTEGYRMAEVTAGGVDTNELSSKTMETKNVPGLFFIGEVVDVTGHLGGFNFQWAWSSGHVAGQVV